MLYLISDLNNAALVIVYRIISKNPNIGLYGKIRDKSNIQAS
jgi:hypothetical protein